MSKVFSATAIEDIKNGSICIYENNSVKNYKDDYDILTHTCVYADICDCYCNGEPIHQEMIHKGNMVKCKVINIII